MMLFHLHLALSLNDTMKKISLALAGLLLLPAAHITHADTAPAARVTSTAIVSYTDASSIVRTTTSNTVVIDTVHVTPADTTTTSSATAASKNIDSPSAESPSEVPGPSR
jgi:hypothetical protein